MVLLENAGETQKPWVISMQPISPDREIVMRERQENQSPSLYQTMQICTPIARKSAKCLFFKHQNSDNSVGGVSDRGTKTWNVYKSITEVILNHNKEPPHGSIA